MDESRSAKVRSPPTRFSGSTLLRAPIVPERIRGIDVDGGGFAFVSNRFLRQGFFASLRANELRLYVLLVLAADRRGLSFYHYDTICSLLEMTLDDYVAALRGLIEKDLVAHDGSRFQVLSLPEAPRRGRPIPIASSFDDQEESVDPKRLEIRRMILESLRNSTPR